MKVDKNIELHGNSLRVIFYVNKVKCRENLHLSPTQENIKKAKLIRDDINSDIRRKKFCYADYFPESPRRKLFELKAKSFTLKTMFEEHIEFYQKSNYAENTKRDYIRYIQNELIPAFGKIAITELTPSNIKDWILSRKQSSKYVSNLLIPFAALLDDAKNEGIIAQNPINQLSLKRLFKCFEDDSDYEVEPFTKQERRQILGYAEGQLRNLIQFGFYSGLRVGEIIALQWSDFNQDKKMLQINNTLIKGTLHKPKTVSSVREIKLLAQAFDALLDQKELTHNSKFIFHNPNTGRNWYSTDGLRKHWVKLFDQLKIKYRNPYQMRHTFASMLVSRGENTFKVAKYLGHKDTEMVTKIYGKYVPEDESNENIFTANYDNE